jgi:phosphohistidine phosphatase
MKLLVVRHAKAVERDDFSQDDDLRPLTDEGRKIMRSVGERLCELVGEIDFLASSTLVRAVQTAEIIGKEFNIESAEQTSVLVPGESPLVFVQWLSKIKETKRPRTVCVVGHEPHLGMLCSFLLSGEHRSFIEFKKSGACLLEFPDGFVEERAALLRWFVTPKICD